MKISKERSIQILDKLLSRLGLDPEAEVEIEVSRHGILVKPTDFHRSQLDQWLRDEHGSKLAALTTDQMMRLLHDEGE